MSFILIHTNFRKDNSKAWHYFLYAYIPESVSSTSTLYSQGNKSSNRQVGQGHLKLRYNAAGSLSVYSDSKTQVICQSPVLFSIWNDLSLALLL
jgi:hypothetical protein